MATTVTAPPPTPQPSSLTITIPTLPGKELSPNWRGHWSAKAREVSNMRAIVSLLARVEVNKHRGAWIPLEQCTIEVTFHVANRRLVKDDDNARATLKPVIDGLVDAGVIYKNDRKVKVTSVTFIPYSDKAPSTVLEVNK